MPTKPGILGKDSEGTERGGDEIRADQMRRACVKGLLHICNPSTEEKETRGSLELAGQSG